jgi:hypothetical protein
MVIDRALFSTPASRVTAHVTMLSGDPQRVISPPTTLTRQYLPNEHAASALPAIMFETTNTDVWKEAGSTAKGIMIGIFSVLGAAGFVLILAVIVYYFRYTQQGRIFLDRITRPGEYDDEQQFAKEEAEALEEMDDIQRMEYLRAKGTNTMHLCIATDCCTMA